MRHMSRQKLSDERKSITHHFEIPGEVQKCTECGAEIHAFPTSPHIDAYVTCGMWKDGTIGEIFIVHSGHGTFIRGLLDVLALTISIALQWGVPLQAITRKMRRTRFGPFGRVMNTPDGMTKEGRPFNATSVADYLAAWLDYRFPDGKLRKETREELVSRVHDDG